MKIFILTQDENLYLPASFAKVCEKLDSKIVAIISSPAMSTHGGFIQGLIKHAKLFGLLNTIRIAFRVLMAKIKARVVSPSKDKAFYSIKAVADYYNIPFYYIKRINSDDFNLLLDQYGPDLLISISCPQIIRKQIRGRFPSGCINVHGAPLPKYRGLMPAFWALRNNEKTTAVTVHDLADKLDNGDILEQRQVTINSDDTWDSLVRKTKAVGAEALIDTVIEIETGEVLRKPNLDSEATYFSFPDSNDRKTFLKSGRKFI